MRARFCWVVACRLHNKTCQKCSSLFQILNSSKVKMQPKLETGKMEASSPFWFDPRSFQRDCPPWRWIILGLLFLLLLLLPPPSKQLPSTTQQVRAGRLSLGEATNLIQKFPGRRHITSIRSMIWKHRRKKKARTQVRWSRCQTHFQHVVQLGKRWSLKL